MVKEVLVLMQYWWGELIQNKKTENLKMGDENVKDYVLEKLKEVLVFMQYWWEELIHWVDKVFPPETRGDKFSHWVQVGKPFLIAGLVLLMLICCFKCCCKCCCGGRRSVRMMKAPGRNARMPRNVFERNPRSYFQNLRSGNSIDDLC